MRRRAIEVTERSFLKRVRPGEIAFLWSEVSLATAHELKRRGISVVREKTNCHKASAFRILEDAYERVGLRPSHGLTPALIAKEREELDLADYVFASSPAQALTLTENGVPPDKVIDTSYGWDPVRLAGGSHSTRAGAGITVLFAGSVSIRKGAHLLLEAWVRSRIPGRLILAGPVDPVFADKFADLLNRRDVLDLGFVRKIGPLYRSADIFAFPSLEEGGPLVTYEAAASGLPSVVSPMGAGRPVRNGKEGLVIEPYDVDGWVCALQSLAGSAELRRTMGAAARVRAAEFTWERVAAGRRKSLLDRYCNSEPDCAIDPASCEPIADQ